MGRTRRRRKWRATFPAICSPGTTNSAAAVFDGHEVKVVRNDAISLEEAGALQPESLIISPGPGTPDDAGVRVEAIRN